MVVGASVDAVTATISGNKAATSVARKENDWAEQLWLLTREDKYFSFVSSPTVPGANPDSHMSFSMIVSNCCMLSQYLRIFT